VQHEIQDGLEDADLEVAFELVGDAAIRRVPS